MRSFGFDDSWDVLLVPWLVVAGGLLKFSLFRGEVLLLFFLRTEVESWMFRPVPEKDEEPPACR